MLDSPTDAKTSPRRGPHRLAAGALGIVAFAAGVAVAQQQEYTLSFRDTDLRSVIEIVGDATGRNFIPDPRVRGTVWMVTNTPMTLDEFYGAFEAILNVNGFATIEDGPTTRIVPDTNARAMFSDAESATRDGFVTRVVFTDYVNAAQLVPILRPLQQPYETVAQMPDGSALVMVGRASNVERLAAIVAELDREASAEDEYIRLQNAFAEDLAQTLRTLIQSQQTGNTRAPRVQVQADARTNAIILSGSGEERIRYRMLIEYLDQPVQGGGDLPRVRFLDYADAEELAASLSEQFGGVVTAEAGAEGAPVPPTEVGPVQIWAHVSTNSLVVTAPSRTMQNILSLVDQLDIPRAQVLLEAIIAEVSQDKAAQLGVTWIFDGSDDDNAIGLTNFGSTSPGIVQLGAAAESDTPPVGAIVEGLTLGAGRVRDAGTSWAALLNALRGDNDNNVMTWPQVVVLDNAEATFQSGQNVPFRTGQFTSTGASEGAVNPFTTINREDVGTTLTITPQINEGNGMRLTINLEQSAVAGSLAGAADIITNQNTITTEVFAWDGEILVLGGLIDDQLRENEQGVPVLRRIPGLKWLFSNRSTDRSRTNLMLFIRPTILRDSIQAGLTTSQKYEYIRQEQLLEAEEPVQLMREETRPLLPELPPAPEPAEPVESGGAEPAEGNNGAPLVTD